MTVCAVCATVLVDFDFSEHCTTGMGLVTLVTHDTNCCMPVFKAASICCTSWLVGLVGLVGLAWFGLVWLVWFGLVWFGWFGLVWLVWLVWFV